MTARERIQEVCDLLNKIQANLVEVVTDLNTVYLRLGLKQRVKLWFPPLDDEEVK